MIYIVGAGPGDPELLSLKAYRLIQEASCIVYAGSLVNPEILTVASPECALYDSASMNLKEIISVLVEHDIYSGSCVVRLHTGDPCIYGAIQEQIDVLKALGHRCELVPGISSFSAAAASLGRELTLPEISQTLVISRNPGKTLVPQVQHPKYLAKLQASYCFFLSVNHAENLAYELIEGGLAPDTPVACVYKASWPDERIMYTKLDSMAQDIKAAGFRCTTMIVIGQVLGARLDEKQLGEVVGTRVQAGISSSLADELEGNKPSSLELRYRTSKLYDEDFSHGYR